MLSENGRGEGTRFPLPLRRDIGKTGAEREQVFSSHRAVISEKQARRRNKISPSIAPRYRKNGRGGETRFLLPSRRVIGKRAQRRNKFSPPIAPRYRKTDAERKNKKIAGALCKKLHNAPAILRQYDLFLRQSRLFFFYRNTAFFPLFGKDLSERLSISRTCAPHCTWRPRFPRACCPGWRAWAQSGIHAPSS